MLSFKQNCFQFYSIFWGLISILIKFDFILKIYLILFVISVDCFDPIINEYSQTPRFADFVLNGNKSYLFFIGKMKIQFHFFSVNDFIALNVCCFH